MNCFPFTSTRVHLPVFIGFVLFNLHEHTSSSPGVYWIRLVQSSRAHEFISRCLLDSSCSIFTSTRVHLPVFIGFVLFNLHEHTSSPPGVYWIRLVQSSRAHEFTSRCLLDSSCSIFTSTRVHLPVFIGFVLFNLHEHTSSSPGVYWIRLVQSSRAHEFTSRCLLDSSCSIFTSTRVHLPVFIGFVLFNLQFSVYSVVDNCLNFCPFFLSFDYCIVCPSLIKYFWLSLWYLHTFVKAL